MGVSLFSVFFFSDKGHSCDFEFPLVSSVHTRLMPETVGGRKAPTGRWPIAGIVAAGRMFVLTCVHSC